MDIKYESIKGVKWAFIARSGKQIIQVLTYTIFAHILNPRDFGVMSMATIVVGFADTIRDMGFSSAIIQKKEISNKLLNSVFWINVAIGFILALAIYLSSNFVSNFFDTPDLMNILKLLSIIFIIVGFGGIFSSLLERNLQFKKLYVIEIIASLLSASLGIVTALSGGKILSLVVIVISFHFFSTIMFVICSKWKPKFSFSLKEAKSIFSFSFNITGFNIINYFSRNSDYIIIGKLLGSTDLGYYTLAYKIMLYPLQYISQIITKVTFPVFSRIQDDLSKIKTLFLSSAKSVSLVTFPLMLSLIVLADPIVMTILGPKWVPMILLLQILAPVGLIQSIIILNSSLFLSKGKSKQFFYWGLLSSTITVLAIFIGINWGITGVAIAYAISVLLLLYPAFVIPFKLVEIDLKDFVFMLSKPLIYGIVVAVIIFVSEVVIDIYISYEYFCLIISLTIGLIFYAILLNNFEKELIAKLKSHLRKN